MTNNKDQITQSQDRHPRGLPADFDMGTTREEVSLAEFPLGLMAQRHNPGQLIHIEELIGSDANGVSIYRKWIVEHSKKYGLPLAGDHDILVAFIKLAEHTRFTQRVLPHTRYQICQILGAKPDGRAYRRIGAACHRYAGLKLHNDNVFKDPATKTYIREQSFGIIDAFKFSDRSPAAKSQTNHDGFPPNYIRFSDEFLARLRDGNLMLLDLDFYRSLRTPLSRRLYEFLLKNRWRKTHYEIGVAKLAQRLPLSTTLVKEIKRQLVPYLEEQKEKAFLNDYSFERARQGWKLRVAYNLKFEPYKARKPRTASTTAATPQLPTETNLALFPPLQETASANDQQLVRRFHERIHGAAPTNLSKNELANARKLRALQGSDELALYTVDFACGRMQQSNWHDVENFAAVLSNGYPERARDAYEADQKAATKRREEQRLQAMNDAYSLWYQNETARLFAYLSPDEQDRLIDQAAEGLDRDFGRKIDPRVWTPDRRRDWARRQASKTYAKGKLPTFREWLDRQGSPPEPISSGS